jgi:hypothetical protein
MEITPNIFIDNYNDDDDGDLYIYMPESLTELQKKILDTQFRYELKKDYYKCFPSPYVLFEMFQLRKYLQYLRYQESTSV